MTYRTDSKKGTRSVGVARQWWGEAVGSDPARQPVLHEALAQFSALLYVQDVHGAEAARQVQEDQLRGVYQVYRTFGGEDAATLFITTSRENLAEGDDPAAGSLFSVRPGVVGPAEETLFGDPEDSEPAS